MARVVRAFAGNRRRGVLLGPGDDAALLAPAPRGRQWVLTCDAFLENVHFQASVHPPEAAGYKALARATSDLAAMGAQPEWFLLSLALPTNRAGDWLDDFLKGMARCAAECRLALAGGDTAQHATVAVNMTVCGSVRAGRALLRSGARPGDRLWVTGRLGAAQLGLELILRGLHADPRWKRLLRQQLRPRPRIAAGAWLAERRMASAMMDISDGLSLDLARMCHASRVGARVWAAQLPLVRVPEELEDWGLDPLEMALHGGEDYELLFTISPRRAARLPRSLGGVRLTEIGEITRSPGIVLAGPRGGCPLLPRAWDHFR